MAPVNPYATPPLMPARTPAADAALRPAAPQAGFEPGLTPPRAAPRLADLIRSDAPPRDPAPSADASAAPQGPGVPRGFTLQQLSAYAGLVIEEAAAPPPSPVKAQAAAPAVNAPGQRPLPPGSRLDLKV